MARSRTAAVPVASFAAVALAAACLSSPDNQPPSPFQHTPVEAADGGGLTRVTVAGYAWDPEAVQYAFGMCGSSCKLNPTLTPGQRLFERTLIPSAAVSLWPVPAGQPAEGYGGAADGGFWALPNVLRNGDSETPSTWLYASTDGGQTPAAAIGDATPDGGVAVGPSALGPVPAAQTYLPTTLASAPIVPQTAQCIGRPAAAISDVGILSAVAKYKSAGGATVLPADFVDPGKYSGAIVWWVYGPDGQYVRKGLAGAALSVQVAAPADAPAGYLLPTVETIYVSWGCTAGTSPPGQAPCPSGAAQIPPAASSTRSARNFYVPGPSATSSNVGIAVALLKGPVGAVPPVVTIGVADTVVNGSATPARPYSFNSYPPPAVRPLPGQITFGETLADPAIPVPLPDYLCAP
jgi:hypothetical protein